MLKHLGPQLVNKHIKAEIAVYANCAAYSGASLKQSTPSIMPNLLLPVERRLSSGP